MSRKSQIWTLDLLAGITIFSIVVVIYFIFANNISDYNESDLNEIYNDQQLKRIALFSENLKKFTAWNGEGDIREKDKIRLQHVIDSVHALNKKVRFWNAPDNTNAWKTFIEMGIDYINTDHIIELAEYLNNHGKL